MTTDQKLDEILTIVRNIGTLDASTADAQREAREAKEERDDTIKYLKHRQEKSTEAALTALDIMKEATWLMNHATSKEDAEEFAKRRTAYGESYSNYLHFCREEGVWADYEDPFYDPNDHE